MFVRLVISLLIVGTLLIFQSELWLGMSASVLGQQPASTPIRSSDYGLTRRPPDVEGSGSVSDQLASILADVTVAIRYAMEEEDQAEPLPTVRVNRHTAPDVSPNALQRHIEEIRALQEQQFQEQGVPEPIAHFLATFNAEIAERLAAPKIEAQGGLFSGCEYREGRKTCPVRP